VIFFQSPGPQIRRNRAGNSTTWKDFSSMFGFTMANFVVVIPYILAFFAMFGIGAGGAAEHTPSSLLTSLFIIAGFFCGAAVWWWLLTSIISLFRRRFRPRHMLTINRVAGIIIGLLGVYTILSTFLNNIIP
jgi:arginine exporter protein ArgO